MGPTLSAVLDDARRRGFVGRSEELRSFAAALAGTDPVRVLLVHGPGGIGKSSLLDELRRRRTDLATCAHAYRTSRQRGQQVLPEPPVQELGDLRADLVVDAGGRRSTVGRWIVDPGGRAPVEERADCGFAGTRRFGRRDARPPAPGRRRQGGHVRSGLARPAVLG